MPHRWYNTNYYHWTIETIARFRIWQIERKRIKNLKILVNNFKTKSFQHQWLRLLNIEEKDCVIIDENCNYNLNDAFFCKYR